MGIGGVDINTLNLFDLILLYVMVFSYIGLVVSIILAYYYKKHNLKRKYMICYNFVVISLIAIHIETFIGTVVADYVEYSYVKITNCLIALIAPFFRTWPFWICFFLLRKQHNLFTKEDNEENAIKK